MQRIKKVYFLFMFHSQFKRILQTKDSTSIYLLISLNLFDCFKLLLFKFSKKKKNSFLKWRFLYLEFFKLNKNAIRKNAFKNIKLQSEKEKYLSFRIVHFFCWKRCSGFKVSLEVFKTQTTLEKCSLTAKITQA